MPVYGYRHTCCFNQAPWALAFVAPGFRPAGVDVELSVQDVSRDHMNPDRVLTHLSNEATAG